MPQVQYIFGDGEQVVKVKSHGNSEGVGSRSFKRAMKSTRDSLKDKLKRITSQTSCSCHSVRYEKGGIMKIESAGDIPRNRSQVYNLNREVKRQNADSPLTTGDPLLSCLSESKRKTTRAKGRHNQRNAIVSRANRLSRHGTTAD